MAIPVGSIGYNSDLDSVALDAILTSYGTEINRVAAIVDGRLIAGSAGALANTIAERDGGGGLTATALTAGTGLVSGGTVSATVSMTAPLFHGVADSATSATSAASAASVPLSGVTGFGAANTLPLSSGSGWTTGLIGSPNVTQGGLTDDRLSGLWYTAGGTALTVHVASKNVWNVSTFIQFAGGTSAAISTAGLTTGQARIDLLYIDGSGALQWQLGTAASAASAALPPNPTNAFIPVVYVKTYFGAASITGYTDQGHDAYFYADARTPTTPLSAAALGAHSVAFSRVQDGAAFQTSPASTTINVGAIAYFNSVNVFQQYPGGAYTYANSALTNSQPRWDLLYLDDAHNLAVTQGTPAVTPTQPTTAIGQWPVAFIYIPANTTTMVDLTNYTAATGQGYIQPAPGYLRSMTTGTALTSAVLGTPVVSGGVITSIPVTSGGGGYTVAPAIIITGSNTTPASAHAVLTSGVLTSVVIDSGGTGYGTPTAAASSSGSVQSIALGGTAATSAAAARTNLSAAASGANGDITSMTALATVSGNVSHGGRMSFSGASITDVPVTIQALGGQTAALRQYKSSGGVVIGEVAADGRVGIGVASAAGIGVNVATLASGTTAPYGLVNLPTLQPSGTPVSAIGANLGAAIDTTNGVLPSAYGVVVPALTHPTGANAITNAGSIFLVGQTIGTNNYAFVSSSQNPSGFGVLAPTDLVAINLSTQPAGSTPTQTMASALLVQGPTVQGGSAVGSPVGAPTNVGSGMGVAATFANADALAHLVSNAIAGAGWQQATHRFARRDNSGLGGYNIDVETHADLPSFGTLSSEKSSILVSSRTLDPSQYATPGTIHVNASGGAIISGSVDTAGSGYNTAPTVTIGGTGTGATAHATISGGAITAVIIDTPGTGYGTGSVAATLNSPTITRDMVGVDIRANIGAGNSTGRLWGLGIQSNVETGGDGLAYIMETYLINNASTDQAIMNTNTSKYGIHLGSAGTMPGTAAVFVDGDNLGTGHGAWHKGIYMNPINLMGGASDSFLELFGVWIVKKDGSTGINQPTPAAALHVAQGVVGTPAAKIVGIAGSTTNLAQIDATPFNANAQVVHFDNAGHQTTSQAAAPTAAPGTGLGASATVTLTGSDQEGFVTVVTGASGLTGANGTAFTVTFKNAWQATPRCAILEPANGAALNLARNQDIAPIQSTYGTGSWAAALGSVALAASTTYVWSYFVR